MGGIYSRRAHLGVFAPEADGEVSGNDDEVRVHGHPPDASGGLVRLHVHEAAGPVAEEHDGQEDSGIERNGEENRLGGAALGGFRLCLETVGYAQCQKISNRKNIGERIPNGSYVYPIVLQRVGDEMDEHRKRRSAKDGCQNWSQHDRMALGEDLASFSPAERLAMLRQETRRFI